MQKMLVQLVGDVFMSESEWLRNKKPSWLIKAVGKSGKFWTVPTAAEARRKLRIGLVINIDELMAIESFELSAGPPPPTGARQTIAASGIIHNHISQLSNENGIIAIPASQYKYSCVKAPENRTVIVKEDQVKKQPVKTEPVKPEPKPMSVVYNLETKEIELKEKPVAKRIEIPNKPKQETISQIASPPVKENKFVFVHELNARSRCPESVKLPAMSVRLLKGAPSKNKQGNMLLRFTLSKDVVSLLGWKDKDLFVIGFDPYTGEGVIRRAVNNANAFKLTILKNVAFMSCGMHPELGIQKFEGAKVCTLQTNLIMTESTGCVEELSFIVPKEIMVVNAK